MAQESDDRYQRRSSDDRERPSRPRGEGRPPRGARRFPRRRMDPLSADGIQHVDYKDVPRLRGFLSDMGKISPRRKTGVSAKHQRSLATAIKRARHLALLPYTERERDTRGQGGSGGRRGGPRGGRGS